MLKPHSYVLRRVCDLEEQRQVLTSSPGWMPALSAGPPWMGARTTSFPLVGSAAISSPTPCTSPSELTLKFAYSLRREVCVRVMAITAL